MMNRKPSSVSERVLPINLNSARIADVDAPVCHICSYSRLATEL